MSLPQRRTPKPPTLSLAVREPVPIATHVHHHAVQFYDDEAFLATVVSEFLGRGLTAGQPVVVIATPAHRKAFLDRLRADGVDVDDARGSGRFVIVDARRTLDQFMAGPMPDALRFRAVVGDIIEGSLAGRDGNAVCAYGEMVDLLWNDGNGEGAIRLEALWNELATSYRFSLLCAYSMSNFSRSADAGHFEQICAQHSHVSPTEHYVQGDDGTRLLEISRLQQRSRALEAEIQYRESLEQHLLEVVGTLHQREQDLRDVLENAAEGIHLVDADGVIQWANNAELALLGYRADEYIGRHITEFHEDRGVIAHLLGELTNGRSVHDYRARLRHKDGSLRHVSINSNARYEQGKFVNARCFTRDISAAHEATLERERALERERIVRATAEQARMDAERANVDATAARALAEQANRAKSEFLAVMSHELRTPLNAIGGYAELMELGIHGPVSPAQRDSLERIQRSQRLLLGLVNQVLNYARVETGNVRYELADVALDEALRFAEGLVVPQMRTKGLRFEYEGCDASVSVRADGEKLQQIVLNLLTNSAKFTDRGGRVGLSVLVADATVAISVTDSGIGIPCEKLDVIFDPFIQVDANYTRTRDGVGLGLAISRDLARGMGGELRVRSEEGKGSVFTLELPVGES